MKELGITKGEIATELGYTLYHNRWERFWYKLRSRLTQKKEGGGNG